MHTCGMHTGLHFTCPCLMLACLPFTLGCAEMMMRDPRPAWMDTYNFPRQLCSEQLFRKNASMYDCLLVALGEHPELQGEYHANLPTWLDNFPREQFYVVQVGAAGGLITSGMPHQVALLTRLLQPVQWHC